MTYTSDFLNKNNIVSVVDDGTETEHLLIDALHTIRGITIFRFTDPSMALEHFKTNKEDYAIMISNLRLPVINGVQLLKTVKDLNPSVRTALITEHEINDKILQEYNKNEIINSFLKKPIELNQLLSEVNKQIYCIEYINKK